MTMNWIHENPPHWDESKARLLGSAPDGSIKVPGHEIGDLMSGEWWRVDEDGAVAGYGWMDTTWGDAEVLLVVDAGRRGRGVGTFILDQLEREAGARGLNYLYNVVPARHPDRGGFAKWLEKRGFESKHEDLHRRRVSPGGRNSAGVTIRQ
jgi:GNAT superfamily N-acetyltransferase